jgi:hypothetical protein
MKAQLVDEVLSLMQARVKSQPSSVEFEMAYQVRVAIDRIRFAIKATDQFTHHPRQLQEAVCNCWTRWIGWNRQIATSKSGFGRHPSSNVRTRCRTL